jgi:hypothetical protein
MMKKLNEKLLSINEQIKEVEHKFASWKGENKQIDDVLVIGLKFSDI